MYEAELLGGPLHGKTYAVAYNTFSPILQFIESEKPSVYDIVTRNQKPITYRVIYRQFLANLYIFEKRIPNNED